MDFRVNQNRPLLCEIAARVDTIAYFKPPPAEAPPQPTKMHSFSEFIQHQRHLSTLERRHWVEREREIISLFLGLAVVKVFNELCFIISGQFVQFDAS